MVITNTCPNLSNIVRTNFELGRVISTVVIADPGIIVLVTSGVLGLRSQYSSISHDQGIA